MKIFQNRVFQGTAVFGSTALFLYIAVTFLNLGIFVSKGIFIGFFLSTFNGLVTFLALSWAIERSNKIFFGTFFGGIIWKLVVLGSVFFYWTIQSSFQIVPALVSLALTTFLFNIFGMIFLFNQTA